MKTTVNVLVLGAGRFGINYTRILARLNSRQIPTIPRIGRLIVTRTSLEGARTVVATIKEQIAVTADGLIPEKVANSGDLRRVLDRYHPALTAIVARDPAIGDSIHSRYADIALVYGAVLSEKPFMPATGDGASLKILDALAAKQHAHPLGLELPMAVVGQQLWQVPALRGIIENAGDIRFRWEAAVRGAVSLMDDLVLHPWSMLPPFFQIEVQHVSQTPEKADIGLLLTHRGRGQTVPCRVELVKGGRHRWLSIDHRSLVFQSQGSWVRVWEEEQPICSRDSTGAGLKEGREVLAVDNPLEQHIVAMLQRRPLIGIEQIRRSQRLLENLHSQAAS